MLGKLPVPGRPTNLDYSRARAYCPCSRCGWGLFGHFYSHLSFSPLSPSLWETARYRLKYCLKGPLNPKQPTNHPRLVFTINYLNSTYKYNHTVKRFYLITFTEKIRPKRPGAKGRAETIRYLFNIFCLLIYSCTSIRTVGLPTRYLIRIFF